MSTKVPESEANLTKTLLTLSDRSVCMFHIRTREVLRAATALRRAVLVDEKGSLLEWDALNGQREFNTSNYHNNLIAGEKDSKFIATLTNIVTTLRSNGSNANLLSRTGPTYFVFINPPLLVMQDPKVQETLQQLATILPNISQVRVVFIGPRRMTELPLGTLSVIDMNPPSLSELISSTQDILSPFQKDESTRFPIMDEDQMRSLARIGQGMALAEYEVHLSIGVGEYADNYDPDAETAVTDLEAVLRTHVAEGKTETVKQSEILTLVQEADLSEVGGMDALKKWLEDRRPLFADPEAAEEFGARAPKGMLLVGPPGTGKSLVSKATAGGLAIPLIRLDFGKVFSKFVGESEQRLQDALDMVAGMGRIVLFVDEIDKGLGGSNSNLDGGTSRRVLGKFLTWMQEENKEAFVVMSANSVAGLPPEMSRKGRIDQIFSTDLPGSRDRREILDVHFSKIGRDMTALLGEKGVLQLIAKLDGFLPSEIEQVIRDAAILAFTDDDCKDIELRHLVAAAEDIIPMSVSHKEEINAMLEWSRANAKPVSSPEISAPAPRVSMSPDRHIRSRRASSTTH
ncbi:AAA family ATPase [Alcaligenes faecalis]|uniref:AAA family ATPase n=1 Tax=Alcaligenes faecalis TaxID=511 RepID=UPI00068AA522|nr:AAA family ATPase [Alcaligenes faecalis]